MMCKNLSNFAYSGEVLCSVTDSIKASKQPIIGIEDDLKDKKEHSVTTHKQVGHLIKTKESFYLYPNIHNTSHFPKLRSNVASIKDIFTIKDLELHQVIIESDCEPLIKISLCFRWLHQNQTLKLRGCPLWLYPLKFLVIFKSFTSLSY